MLVIVFVPRRRFSSTRRTRQSFFFFSSRRRHTSDWRDWSSDVCSSDMNAMRVGLLTKFMGYLGMIAAGASLLLIGSAPALLIEVFWLLAVGYLLAGRWPNGDPVAWKTGQAEPWPTAAEVREQRQQVAA